MNSLFMSEIHHCFHSICGCHYSVGIKKILFVIWFTANHVTKTILPDLHKRTFLFSKFIIFISFRRLLRCGKISLQLEVNSTPDYLTLLMCVFFLRYYLPLKVKKKKKIQLKSND